MKERNRPHLYCLKNPPLSCHPRIAWPFRPHYLPRIPLRTRRLRRQSPLNELMTYVLGHRSVHLPRPVGPEHVTCEGSVKAGGQPLLFIQHDAATQERGSEARGRHRDYLLPPYQPSYTAEHDACHLIPRYIGSTPVCSLSVTLVRCKRKLPWRV